MSDRPERRDSGPTLSPEQHLVSFLAGRGVPCPRCRYNLRDLLSGRCPECGIPLALTVKDRGRSIVPWLMAVVPCAAAAGLGLPLLLLELKERVWHSPDLANVYARAGLVYLWAMVPLAVALCVSRRRFMRLRRRWQWGVGAAVLLVTAAMVAILGYGWKWV